MWGIVKKKNYPLHDKNNLFEGQCIQDNCVQVVFALMETSNFW